MFLNVEAKKRVFKNYTLGSTRLAARSHCAHNLAAHRPDCFLVEDAAQIVAVMPLSVQKKCGARAPCRAPRRFERRDLQNGKIGAAEHFFAAVRLQTDYAVEKRCVSSERMVVWQILESRALGDAEKLAKRRRFRQHPLHNHEAKKRARLVLAIVRRAFQRRAATIVVCIRHAKKTKRFAARRRSTIVE